MGVDVFKIAVRSIFWLLKSHGISKSVLTGSCQYLSLIPLTQHHTKNQLRLVDTVVNFSLFGEQVDCFWNPSHGGDHVGMAQTFLAIKSVEQISQKVVLWKSLHLKAHCWIFFKRWQMLKSVKNWILSMLVTGSKCWISQVKKLRSVLADDRT